MITRIKTSIKTRRLVVAAGDTEVHMRLDVSSKRPAEYNIVKNLAKLENVLTAAFPYQVEFVEHILVDGGAIAAVSTAVYAILGEIQKKARTTNGENTECRNTI